MLRPSGEQSSQAGAHVSIATTDTMCDCGVTASRLSEWGGSPGLLSKKKKKQGGGGLNNGTVFQPRKAPADLRYSKTNGTTGVFVDVFA